MKRLIIATLVLWACPVFAAHAQDAPECVTGVPTAAPAPTGRELTDLATGKDVTVAVIDTGVAAHPALGDVRPGPDFINPDQPDPHFDCDGHGTAVAGVIRAHAPDAQIVAIRQTAAHAETDSGSLATLAEAIHAAIDHGVDLINISVVACLAPDVAVRLDSAPLDDALRRAENAGVAIIAAAGNRSDTCDNASVVYPTHFDTVIGVGAQRANYSLPAPYSASGHVPAALAPDGAGWISALVPPRGEPRQFHGTSFAAPAVTGTAALVLERHPHYTPAQLREHLHDSALSTEGFIDPVRTASHVPGRSPTITRPPLTTQPPLIDAYLPRARQLFGALASIALALACIAGCARPRFSTTPGRARPFFRKHRQNCG